jgi:tetratricopeptide (TPR) repeat protein
VALADRAEAKMRAKQWPEAVALWQQVVELNPVSGYNWARLARAYYDAKEYKKAIPAYEKALELRDGFILELAPPAVADAFFEKARKLRYGFPWASAYRIACCHALLGNRDQAMKWLEKSFAMGWRSLEEARNDTSLKSLHGDARFRDLVGLIDAGKMTRNEGWRYDLKLLVRELKRIHFNLSKKMIPEGLDPLARQIHDDIPKLSDRQVEVALMKLVATVGDGHTLVRPRHAQPGHEKAVGARFYLFREGLFVTAAAPAHKDIVGHRVLRVGGHPVDKVLRAVDPLISRDNEMWPKLVGPGLLRNPQLLNGLGLIPDEDKVTLTLRGGDGKAREVTLKAVAGRPGDDWVNARAETPGPEPLYLKNTKANYWFEYLPDSKVVYFQYNAVADDPKEPLEKFCRRLFAFIDKNDVEKLVIDTRFNGGGNNFLNQPLVHGLVRCDKVNQRGKLFVIVGRNTFSAAQCGVTHIERNADAIFVGEPTGSCPNFVGESIMLSLPYSKMRASISDLYWQNSVAMDYRTWIAPQIYTPPTFAAYRGKKDPAMEAIQAFRATAARGERSAGHKPADAVELAERAEAKMRAKQWPEAVALWQQVVELNPVSAYNWARLARACYDAKEYKKAIPAYEKALELRYWFPSGSAYRIAGCHALLGNRDQAMKWLEKSFAMGWRSLEEARKDADLKSLRGDRRFRDLVGFIDASKLTREEGWRYDLQLLVRELKRIHFNLSKKIIPKGFDSLARQIHDDIPKLSDRQIEVALMKLVATVGDGHTRVRPLYAHWDHQKALPAEFYLFQEGLFITAAAPAHKDIVGHRVLRVGGHPVDTVLRAVDPLISRDNEMWPKLIGPGLLRNPQLLNGLGLIPEQDRVTLTLRGGDGKTREVTLKADAGRPGDDWVNARAATPGPEPLYQKNPKALYWFEYLPDSKLVYFQYNEVADDPKEPLEKFCRRLFAFIGKNDVEKLVIDTRFNDGGNNFLNQPLVHGLIRCDKVNRRGKLFVIIGRNTFSAAQCGVTHIERNTDAIFVGEPTGSCPNHVGESNVLNLPYSKMRASISNLYWQNSVAMDYRTWIAPHIYTPPTFAAYRGKKDPALEAILAFRTTKRADKEPPVESLVGRYAKGVNVLRVEAFGDRLLALPVWWGATQPLDRRAGATFEMQNRREAAFTFEKGSLTVTGHRELDGTYRKLGSELTPMELLLAGKKGPALKGFRALGLEEQAIVRLVEQCLVNLPSRRQVLYDFARDLVHQRPRDRGVLHLAASAAVMVGDRAAAKTWYGKILKEKSDDAVALKAMRMMGHTATAGGWRLPFPLADAYAPPTAAEFARVRAAWKNRDLKPRGIRKEHEARLNVNGVALRATAISYRIHGRRNFGVVLVPLRAQKRRYPVLVELKGVSPSYWPLDVPGTILALSILGAEIRKFVVFLPGVRGEKVLFAGKTYQCEGDPDDSWDGATDDAIAFISAGLDSCPQADAKQIVAFGKSRGGAVAMLLGARDPRVRAIVSWSGPAGWIENMPQSGWSQFELVREGISAKASPFSTAGQAIRTFFKPAIDGKRNLAQTRDRLIASSPIYFVRQLPAAQLHYGVNDYVVSSEEGRSIEAALARLVPRRADISVMYEKDGGHDLNPKTAVPSTRRFLLKYAS